MTYPTTYALVDLSLNEEAASKIAGGSIPFFLLGAVTGITGAVIGGRWGKDIADALDTGITEQDVRDAICEGGGYCPNSSRTRRRTIRNRRRSG